MTCPACQKPLTPGAWCDNGHPLRRARRLSGAERDAMRLEAEARRDAERTHAALVEVARPVVESAERRRFLYRRGELSAELAEAVKVGLIATEDATRLETETAAEVARMHAAREDRNARMLEAECAREPMDAAGFKPPFRYDGHCYIFDAAGEMAADRREGWRARGWGRISHLPDAGAIMDAWEVWVADAVGDAAEGEEVARRMNVKAGWTHPTEPQPMPSPRHGGRYRRGMLSVAAIGLLLATGTPPHEPR